MKFRDFEVEEEEEVTLLLPTLALLIYVPAHMNHVAKMLSYVICISLLTQYVLTVYIKSVCTDKKKYYFKYSSA